jgi:RNA polymerase sigma factor (sigma-70 family)
MEARFLKTLPVRELQSLFSHGAMGGRSDAELLGIFVSNPDEVVFEAIIRRHGPMVWGVCRRVLRDHHDAEDAFQATFLVLARKAASIMPQEKLGNWLYGVAYQTARKARATTSNRKAMEKQVPDMPEPEAGRDGCRDDLLPLLDQELSRLPEKYRLPIVLCDLEGKTHRQAAQQLNWPVGTVSGRLSRGRAMLGERLTRRGFTLAGGSLAMVLSQGSASASVPLPLITSTTRAATRVAAGQAVTGVVSTKVAALAEGVLKGMLMTKLKFGTALLLLVVLGTAGTRPFSPSRRAEAASPAKGFEETGLKSVQSEAPAASPRRDSTGADEEMKKLEGTWAIVDACERGEWATADLKEKGLGRVVIKGDKMTMFAQNSRETKTSFDVDPSQSPKAIGIVQLNDKSEEEGHVQIKLGIYELKGDTLTICAGLDRPDSFEVVPGSKRDLLVLKWARR